MKKSLSEAARILTLAAVVVCALFGASAVFAQSITILPRDAVWSYDDGGRDLGSTWRGSDFADTGWKKGKAPLGFGDDVSETDPKLPIGTVVGFGPNPETKNMTTYLRTEVEVGDVSAFDTLNVYVHADDGAVVYINGTEAFRRGIADGAFIDLADSQAKSEDEAVLSAKTFAAATATVQNASFLAINGDLVDVGMVEQQWDWLFGHAAPTLRALPFVPAAGNHDEDKGSFFNHFNLSPPATAPVVSGAYYSFDWSNAHFIVLNTNEDSPEYADLSPEQVAWFSDDAKAAKKAGAGWIVVLLHKGPYTTSNHATDMDITGTNGVRTKFASLLDDLGVDLVLQGHDHIYARSLPIKDGVTVPAAVRTEIVSGTKVDYVVDPRGPVYVIPSTAGPKVYYRNKKIDPSYFTLFAVADEHHAAKYGPDPADSSRPLRGSVQNFMGITVDGKKITAFTYEIDSKVNGGKPFVVDSFGIIKQ